MLRLLDQNRAVRPPITKYKDLKIINILDTDDKELSFSTPITDCDQELKEENYIQTEDDEYVIKSIDTSNGFYTVTARMNIDELEGTLFESFESKEQTIESAMDLALAGTGWTCTSSLTRKRTLRLTNKSTWEIIKQAIKTYRVEIIIDSLHKSITFVEQRGEDKGTYFTSQLNLKALHVKSNTDNFYTRILPLGKDGMTVESVNNGSKYITDFSYSKKVKTYLWKDERYTVAQNLMDDAKAKLADMAKPYKAYAADIIDLANAYKGEENPYTILSYKIGDTVTLLDEETNCNVKQRIVKTTVYPENPENNTCDIANKVLTFDEYTQKYDDTAETVNNITTDNGTVDGSTINYLDANKLTNLDEVVAKTASFKRVDTEVLNVSGQITAVSERVGTLEANSITAEQADLKYATIENLTATNETVSNLQATVLTADSALIHGLTADVGNINTLMFGSATGSSLTTEFSNSVVSLIGDAQIKSAMLESVTADKVTSGSLYTNKVDVVSESGNLKIRENTILIKDDARARVQIGKDAQDDYNMYVWDADGNLMFDALGLTEKGIQRQIIDNDSVKDDANISADKLNINTLFSVINDDHTHTINSSHVYLDANKQTLDVAFEGMTTKMQADEKTVSGLAETVESQGTSISEVQGKISSKIWQQDISNAVDDLKIGGTNLIRGSKTLVHKENFLASYNITIGLKQLTYNGKALCA